MKRAIQNFIIISFITLVTYQYWDSNSERYPLSSFGMYKYIVKTDSLIEWRLQDDLTNSNDLATSLGSSRYLIDACIRKKPYHDLDSVSKIFLSCLIRYSAKIRKSQNMKVQRVFVLKYWEKFKSLNYNNPSKQISIGLDEIIYE